MADFYVSQSLGSDSFTSTQAQNPATPWKTLTRINNLGTFGIPAGSRFFFRRGDTWTGEALLINSNGTSSAPIVADGESWGPANLGLAKIRPSLPLAKTGWTNSSGSIYYLVTSQPCQVDVSPGTNAIVWEDKTNGTGAPTLLTDVASLAALTSAGQCFYDTGNSRLYVRATDSSNPNTSTWQYWNCIANTTAGAAATGPGSNLGIDLRGDFIECYGFDIQITGHYNAGQRYKDAANTKGCKIGRCTLKYSCHDNIGYLGNNTGIPGPHVFDNVIDYCLNFGIGVFGDGTGWCKDIIVSGNTISNISPQTAGALVAEYDCANVTWSKNTIINCLKGVIALSLGAFRPTNHTFTGNTFMGQNNQDRAIEIDLVGGGNAFGTGLIFEKNTVTGYSFGVLSTGNSATPVSGAIIRQNDFRGPASAKAGSCGIRIDGNETAFAINSNVIYGYGGTGGSAVIGEGGILFNNAQSGSGHVVAHNICDQNFNGIVQLAGSAGSTFANNIATNNTGAGFGYGLFLARADNTNNANNCYANLVNFGSNAIFVVNGTQLDPIYRVTSGQTTASDYFYLSTSPMISTGVTLASVTADYFGSTWRGQQSKGAFQASLNTYSDTIDFTIAQPDDAAATGGVENSIWSPISPSSATWTRL